MLRPFGLWIVGAAGLSKRKFLLRVFLSRSVMSSHEPGAPGWLYHCANLTVHRPPFGAVRCAMVIRMSQPISRKNKGEQ